MVIRSAGMKDLNAVKHLIGVLEEKTMEDTAFTLVYEHQLDDPRFHAFVCENGGRIVAFVNIRIEYQLHHAGKVAQIMELVTEEDCRGSGIGRELFRHVCEYAKEEGCIQIELNSSMRRTDAHHFYETNGMRKDHFNFTMPL
ncbi:MAG: GNAT family N-acetyltransferase [Solobacterium sp.]|nr:GNAT family N-acetyltransferase [Solobacterium sp.]